MIKQLLKKSIRKDLEWRIRYAYKYLWLSDVYGRTNLRAMEARYFIKTNPDLDVGYVRQELAKLEERLEEIDRERDILDQILYEYL